MLNTEKIEILMGQNSPYVWVYSSDRLKHLVLVTLILSLDVVLTSICRALIFSILPEPISPFWLHSFPEIQYLD